MNATTFITPPHSGQASGSNSYTRLMSMAHVWLQRLSTPLGGVWQPLDVLGWDANGNRILLGKIAADQLLISDALSDGMPLLDVCDQDSQGWYEIEEDLFNDKGDFQPELHIDELAAVPNGPVVNHADISAGGMLSPPTNRRCWVAMTFGCQNYDRWPVYLAGIWLASVAGAGPYTPVAD